MAARSDDVSVVLITCPTVTVAKRLARGMVRAHLAACVNVVAGVQSYFWWQGRVDHAKERLLIVKTVSRQLPALRRYITQHHPYTVPELIAVPVRSGLPAYLTWVRSSCTIAR
jgi:periplasmic divalent cation tolerance protein